LYQVYVTLLFGAIGGALVWHTLAAALGHGRARTRWS